MAVNRLDRLLNARRTMPRPKKQEDRSQLATLIPASIHSAVREYSDTSGISISRIVEDALKAYLASRAWPVDES